MAGQIKKWGSNGPLSDRNCYLKRRHLGEV